MSEVLEEIRIEHHEDLSGKDSDNEIKADFMTLGGGVILGVTIFLTLFLVLALLVPKIDRLQLTVVALLTGACWLYLVNRFSEKFRVDEESLEYDSALARRRIFRLEEVTNISLVSLGWSLSGDFYLLEIGLTDRRKPEQIGLGPCWNPKRLSSFIRRVGYLLEEKEQ